MPSRVHRRRSRDRDRDRDRDRHRSRSRERYRRRSRSRDRDRRRRHSPSRRHRRSNSPAERASNTDRAAASTKVVQEDDGTFRMEGALTDEGMLDKDLMQKRLELEMQKRKERIERWREEKKRAGHLGTNTASAGDANNGAEMKSWNLSDDDEDDDASVDDSTSASGAAEQSDSVSQVVAAAAAAIKAEIAEKSSDGSGLPKPGEDEELDPLDAYMMGVQEEMKSLRGAPAGRQPGAAAGGKATGKATVITAVAKRRDDDPSKRKGELMESNQDAMEYSSEEEEQSLSEALHNATKQKEKLAAVDHQKVYYQPYRKDFYIEVPEIASMTPEEVVIMREELEGIKIKGKNCPRPVRSWAQCGVSQRVLSQLKKNGFEKPTPIQAQAVPVIMSGRDMIGIAKTGSGKTLAFLLPLFRHIEDQPPLEDQDGPIGVILTPTRELALQIYKECRKFTKTMGLRCVCVYGGTGISEQIAELKRGCEVIVCTPGRMIDMLAANGGRVTNLRRCTYVVLDEADRMFDMGFEPQVMRIIDNIRPDRQTVMFSATFPRNMEALARKALLKPIEIQVGGRSVVCKDVKQHVVVLDEDTKFYKLLELLGIYQELGSVLVFVEKQESADELMKVLMKHSYPCLALHGGVDQYDRDSIITDFKRGDTPLLVATSVAARGLDVTGLNLVVNYDCPNHYEDYVHRCGRTGRAGNEGHAYTFITPDQERRAGDIVKAFQLAGMEVPEELGKLWEDYKTRMEAEGHKVKFNSGFKGKGFRFDEEENNLASERRKFQRAALGLEGEDEEDGGGDLDQQIEEIFSSKKRVTTASKSKMEASRQAALGQAAAAAGLSGVPSLMSMPSLTPSGFAASSSLIGGGQAAQAKLEQAKMLASRINAKRNLGEDAKDSIQSAAAAIMKGAGTGLQIVTPQVSNKTLAEHVAGRLNAKLGYTPSEDKVEEEEEVVERFEEELEINDFPQNVRWRITSKDVLNHVTEMCDVGISVRGNFVPSGRKPTDDERPLYLMLESISELNIGSAKKEITRLIKEELLKLQTSNSLQRGGRYKVI